MSLPPSVCLSVAVDQPLLYHSLRFDERTYSFWGFVWVHLDDFINPLFHAAAAQDSSLLLPATDIPHLR